MAVSTKKVLITSLVVDLIDIVINLVVAVITGSAVMLTEAFQGFVDSTAMLFLVIGNKRSHKKISKLHPFGYGKELYFWSAMSTFIMLGITAVISFILGWRQFRDPQELHSLYLSFIVLGISLITNGYALKLCAQKLRNGAPGKIQKIFSDSTEVELKTTFILDLLGVVMASIGLVALIAAEFTGNHRLDGLGAMIMAVFLGIMSLVLLSNVRSLVVGQSASKKTLDSIRAAISSDPSVAEIVAIRTMIMGTNVLLINADLRLKRVETARDVAKTIDSIEAKIAASVHEKTFIHIEPEI